uniref:Uncharacterized protein n=1 Tax=viral metagenome TaxID=1070528 RepID=A0A6C0HPV5_9ZZZZ
MEEEVYPMYEYFESDEVYPMYEYFESDEDYIINKCTLCMEKYFYSNLYIQLIPPH